MSPTAPSRALSFSMVGLIAIAVALSLAPVPAAARMYQGAVAVAPPLTQADLAAALRASVPESQECLRAQGLLRAQVRASLTSVGMRARPRLSLRVSVRSPEARACIDTAARRYLVPLMSRWISSPLSASVSVRVAPTPPIVQPDPDGPRNDRYEDEAVHRAVSANQASILACTPGAHGVAGNISMRITVRSDGWLRLEGVQAPPGVLHPGALPCLSQVIQVLRVPAPPAQRTVLHDVPFS